MKPEIEEEVEIGTGWREKCVGLINDNETEVGKVHLGIVHIFDLDYTQSSAREKSMINAGFAPPSELVRQIDEFEAWSQICLKYLAGLETR